VDHYVRLFAEPDGRVPATFQVLFLSGWAPAEGQQRPARRGSADARLADALLLLAAAVQTAALARGFSTTAALMVPPTAGRSGVIAVDGCIEAAL
jgi:hypothetical protein